MNKEAPIEPGYHRASLLGCAGAPEIVVYFDGENYYSFEAVSPTTKLDPTDFILDARPLYLSKTSGKSTDIKDTVEENVLLESSLSKTRDFLIKAANEYKQTGRLSIATSLDGGKLVGEIDALLDIE